MSTKEEVFEKIREHLEMLVEYGLLDEKIYSTMIGYIYDYMQELDGVTKKNLTLDEITKIWKYLDDKDRPQS